MNEPSFEKQPDGKMVFMLNDHQIPYVFFSWELIPVADKCRKDIEEIIIEFPQELRNYKEQAASIVKKIEQLARVENRRKGKNAVNIVEKYGEIIQKEIEAILSEILDVQN